MTAFGVLARDTVGRGMNKHSVGRACVCRYASLITAEADSRGRCDVDANRWPGCFPVFQCLRCDCETHGRATGCGHHSVRVLLRPLRLLCPSLESSQIRRKAGS